MNPEIWDSMIRYGQVELAHILVSVFNTMFLNVDFRKIETNQYKLSQAADLICIVEVIAQKNVLTKSESENYIDACKR